MNNINIFVSSTCYDLSQIRTDISEFIKNSGHNPILSEFENFPIFPELNTIENCIKIVKENADILVLIVGNRQAVKKPLFYTKIFKFYNPAIQIKPSKKDLFFR